MAGQTSARDVARRLIKESVGKHPEQPDGRSTLASVQTACENVHHELTRWFGAAGSGALFSRGLTEARQDHPVLAAVRIGDTTNHVFGDLSSLTATHGNEAIAAALETVLVATLDLLGRIVGDDMVARLLEVGPTNPAPHDETQS